MKGSGNAAKGFYILVVFPGGLLSFLWSASLCFVVRVVQEGAVQEVVEAAKTRQKLQTYVGSVISVRQKGGKMNVAGNIAEMLQEPLCETHTKVPCGAQCADGMSLLDSTFS